MAEFHANALSLVGNFSGPCIIYLNGEAITVKQGNGIEIAKWPYNCIRQFKAEDETGKFSFVSGRRGPYGVAEYNFDLDDVSELQHALSQFTGAQFSTAPISTYQHQQPLSSQQPPLPPLPPGGHHPSQPSHYVNSYSQQRPSSVSSVGRYSVGMGHRTDSVDSVFTSPGHTRAAHPPSTPAPRLPPRDYIHNAPGGDSGMFVSDALNSSGGGYAYARARNSSSTGDLLDSSLSGRSCVPQPSAGGSPRVSSNGHYQHRQLPGSGGDNSPSPQTKAKADGSRARKSSPGTQRKSPLTQSGVSADSESRDSLPDLPPRESHNRPKTNSTGSMPAPPPPSGSSTHKLTKQQTAPSLSQKPSVPPKPPVAPKPAASPKPATSPKPSHPQQNKQQQPPPPTTTSTPQNGQSPSSTPEQLSQEASTSEGGGSTSGTPEPQLLSRSAATSGTTSPIPDSTDLDHIPRSSPTVMRSNRPTLRGRQSPVGKLTKSITTPALSSETYDVPKSLQTQLSADDGGGNIYNNVSLSSSGENPHEPENMYQVPRPTVDSEYRVPRPQDDILNEQRHYHHPKPADEVYKIPTSRPMSGTYSSLLGRTPDNLYSSPRPPPHGTRSPQGVYYSNPPDADDTASTNTADSATTQTSTGNGNVPDGQLYGNVTVGASNETGEAEENFYNVPRPGIECQKSLEKQHQVQSEEKDGVADGLYNIPRSLSNKRPGQAPEAEEGLYKVPRSSTGGSSDQEGLYKVPPRAVKQSGSESPPPKNPYEMIDFDEPRRLRPARSLESLHRVKTLPPRGKGNSYVGLNVDKPSGHPVPTGWIQKQPLPPRPTQQSSSAAADNVYAEIPEDLLAKHRMAKANGRWSPPARGEKTFDNLYVSGPDVADSTQQPNRSLSPYDKLPPPRRPSPEVVASEGVAKAKELARQGYELCLPSGEDPRTSAAGGRTPPISMPPRNIPRKNFDVGIRTQRSMSSSMSGSVPKEGILGTSIPSDSTTPNADEYVIITRSDTRLKYTQTLPKSTSTGQVQLEGSASAVPLPEGDEYEQMNSVKSQVWLKQSLHYSTPNPSLHHSNGASTSVTTTQSMVISTGMGSGVAGGGANHLYGNMEPTDKDFSDLDRVTRPAAPSSEPYFARSKTLPPRRKTVSSSSADSDVFVTTASHNSQGPASIPEDQKTFVPVATHDLGGSSELRLRSCSMDDLLDNVAAKPKRHSYVNVPSDSSTTEPITSSSSSQQNKPSPPTTIAESAAVEPSSTQQGPPKKPKPFPRNSLLRVESAEEQKEQ